MEVLFISGNRLGDAVITTGVLDHLLRVHPGCRLTVACGPAATGVFDRVPNRARTIAFAKRPWDLHWLDLWRRVIGTRWDLVVDFRGSAISHLVRTRRRAVKRRGPGRMFEQCAAALDLRPAPLPTVWTGPEDRALAERLLPAGRPAIAIGPTANWPPKMWPAERFGALVAALRAGPLPQAGCIVLAGPGERERALAEPALRAIPHAIDACGALSIPQVAACLQRCDLFIGNDSGLMHLAAAAGAPTVGLCGATADRAEEMAPAGRRAAWAMAEGPEMTDLSVDRVVDVAKSMLGSRGS